MWYVLAISRIPRISTRLNREIEINYYFFCKNKHVNDAVVQAFGLNAQNGRDYIDRVVAKSLKFPYSVRIINKATGKVRKTRFDKVNHKKIK